MDLLFENHKLFLFLLFELHLLDTLNFNLFYFILLLFYFSYFIFYFILLFFIYFILFFISFYSSFCYKLFINNNYYYFILLIY